MDGAGGGGTPRDDRAERRTALRDQAELQAEQQLEQQADQQPEQQTEQQAGQQTDSESDAEAIGDPLAGRGPVGAPAGTGPGYLAHPPETYPAGHAIWFDPRDEGELAELCAQGMPLSVARAMLYACLFASRGLNLVAMMAIIAGDAKDEDGLEDEFWNLIADAHLSGSDIGYGDAPPTGNYDAEADPSAAKREGINGEAWRQDTIFGGGSRYDGLLEAEGMRRRAPQDEPQPGTDGEAPEMAPLCFPHGMPEEWLMAIIGQCVGPLRDGAGSNEIKEVAAGFGYEPSDTCFARAAGISQILLAFCNSLPRTLERTERGREWAHALPVRGNVPSLLWKTFRFDQYREMGLHGRRPGETAEAAYDRFLRTVRRVNVRVSPFSLRLANWGGNFRSRMGSAEMALLMAIRWLRAGAQEMPERQSGDSRDGALRASTIRSLLAVLHTMLVSTAGIDNTLARVASRVSEEMAMWSAFPQSTRLTPQGLERPRLWAAGCATLHRVDAMRRLAHADRVRLMVLIAAFVNMLPLHYLRGEGGVAMYPADAEPLFKSPPRGGWDDDDPDGDEPAAGSSSRQGMSGSGRRTGEQSRASGTGAPGKRARYGTTRGRSTCAPAVGHA